MGTFAIQADVFTRIPNLRIAVAVAGGLAGGLAADLTRAWAQGAPPIRVVFS